MSLSGFKFEKNANGLECYDTQPAKHIMLVDDEESILKSAERCLAYDDYMITCFQSPKEALKSARHQAYDLIITDQRMPHMSGVELLTQINEVQPQSVGIILSGFSDSSMLLEAINQAHIYQFVCKPWINEDFRILIKKALAHAEQQSETQRLADEARVSSGSMTRHRAQLRELESKYPGITRVDRDENGAIVLNPKH